MNKVLLPFGLFFLFLFPLTPLAFAQLVNDRVVYTGFEPRLAEIEKISLQPKILDTIRLKADTVYALNVRPLPTAFLPDTLAAARMRKEPIARLDRVMLKLGFGNYTTPLVDFHLNSLRAKQNGYFLRFNHLSSSGTISERGFPGTSSNRIKGGYHHLFKPLNLGIEAGYDRQAVHYYGYPAALDSLFPEDSTRQRYSLAEARFYLNSNHRTDSVRLNYAVSLDFYHVTDAYRTQENTFRLAADLNKFTDLFAAEFLGFRTSLDILDFQSDSFGPPLSFIADLHPYMKVGRTSWQVELGAGIVFGGGDSSVFNLYPRLEGSWNIFKKYIQLQGGITGDFERNTFRELYTQNPFIVSNAPIANRNQRYLLHAQVKGAFSDLLSYHLGLSYGQTDGHVFFVNDTLGTVRQGFTTLFDRVNTTTFQAGLNFHYGEKLEIDVEGRYRIPSTLLLEEAWHFPPLDLQLAARYQLGEKMLFRANIHFISGQKARTFNTDSLGTKSLVVVDLNPMVDVRLGATYKLTRKLGFFLDVNNIAAIRYNRYYQYPSFGLTVIGGLRLSL